jgi:hypothetical protein
MKMLSQKAYFFDTAIKKIVSMPIFMTLHFTPFLALSWLLKGTFKHQTVVIKILAGDHHNRAEMIIYPLHPSRNMPVDPGGRQCFAGWKPLDHDRHESRGTAGLVNVADAIKTRRAPT